jgi:triosephosphate isomerase
MRQPLVAGNWKMNGTRESVRALIDGIIHGLAGVARAEVAVCPPFVYLELVGSAVRGTEIALGAQNVSKEEEMGAFTGEIAAPMLKDMGCQYVIVGHSERRTLYGEDDRLVAEKYARARKEDLTPILCIGELLEEREAGKTEDVVARQLDAVIDLAGVASLADSIIAYEPVWAIGTGRTATPEQAQQVHAFIRERIAARSGESAEKVRILYGGSVNAKNAVELFEMRDIDGGLIGGASLKTADFLTICQAAT